MAGIKAIRRASVASAVPWRKFARTDNFRTVELRNSAATDYPRASMS